MDWNKTKTIFILTFFVVDIFLVFQFIEKQNASQLGLISEATIEETLAEENITYVELPKEKVNGNYISAKSKIFKEEDIKSFENQEISLTVPTSIDSTLKEPITLTEANMISRLNQFLKEDVLNGEDYKLWKHDKQTNTLIYFQHYKNKIIYLNGYASLSIQLNEANEIIGYKQWYLDHIEELEEGEDIISAINAIEILYKNDNLASGSHISKIELGYYTLVPSQISTQMLAPTWHIVVNETDDYFVNAIEGKIIKSETK